MKVRYCLTFIFSLIGYPVFADPLSAVDWLSKTLEFPQEVAPETPLSGVILESIKTTKLSDVTKDTVGILPSQISGIPANFWGDSSADRLAAFISKAPTGQLPEITTLWRRIILAEINPPIGATHGDTLLLARLDNLLNAGDLDPAEALLKAADPNNPQLFRRWFDVSILSQRAQNACHRMVSSPNFAPTLQARAFCLARAGDWHAALITLNTGKALGEFTKDEATLIGMFLDPEIFSQSDYPKIPTVLTPLTFVMREALGLPRPGVGLPLAFLHMDLQNKSGWKQRIASAERLTREGSISSIALLDLYLEGKPSASGGVWNRVSAIQELKSALGQNDDAILSVALINAWNSLEPLGLLSALSDWFTPTLEQRSLNKPAKEIAFRLALLHQDANNLSIGFASTKQIDRFIISLLTERFDVPPTDNRQQAIFNALAGRSAKTVLHQNVDDKRLGEAILSALTLLQHGSETDVGDIEVALSVMAYGGFKTEAKRIAVQLLILGVTT